MCMSWWEIGRCVDSCWFFFFFQFSLFVYTEGNVEVLYTFLLIVFTCKEGD